MTRAGREETRPEIQSQTWYHVRYTTMPPGGSAWEAENLVWSLCSAETEFDTGDGLKWKS